MNTLETKTALRAIPPVQDILTPPSLDSHIRILGREEVLGVLRHTMESLKGFLLSDPDFCIDHKLHTREDLHGFLLEALDQALHFSRLKKLQKVINATGIVLHTNLGRAPLPEAAMAKVQETACGYSNLEYDLREGKRGSRYDHLEEILCRITGSEGAMIVNNNAGAVFLCLNTFAQNKEVVVSRGEQVEIGGSFRIPEIIQQSGCLLREVGTTNKTIAADYEQAIRESTAILLKVHTSNYKVIGFVSSVELSEIAMPDGREDLLRMEDLGSGCLLDLSSFGLPKEKTPMDSLRNGADLVTFSGDKLLGGSQAGIILGKRELIDRIKKNPLTRILRCDKLTIAALHAVLQLYEDKNEAAKQIPGLSMLFATSEELHERAHFLADFLRHRLPSSCHMEVFSVEEEAGGGSLPGIMLKGSAIALTLEGLSAKALHEKLRRAFHPIIARISENRLLLHVRTLSENSYETIAEEIKRIAGESI